MLKPNKGADPGGLFPKHQNFYFYLYHEKGLIPAYACTND